MRFKKGDFVKIVNWEKAKSYEINCPSSYILCNEKIKNGMIGQIILSASHSYNPPRWCIQFKENMNFEEVIGDRKSVV